MKDTSPAAAKRFQDLLMARSGTQRLMMGCSMFDAAKTMVLAGIRSRNPSGDDQEIKKQLFLQLYGQDFTSEKRDKVLAHLLKH